MTVIKPLDDLAKYLNHLVQGRLWLKVILGLILGVGVGVLLNPALGFVSEETSTVVSDWLNLPGQIFMKLVQMVMIPLIFASIITGLVSNVSDKLGSFGLSLFIYFMFTTVIAITIGAILSFVFNPGEIIRINGGFAHDISQSVIEHGSRSMDFNLTDSISNLIPANPLEAMLTGNMLGIVIFTVIIGIAITQLEIKTMNPVIRLIEAVQKICMIVVGWAMRLVPFAVFGLIAALVATTGIDIFKGLGYYILIVIMGLVLLLVFYLLIYFIVIRKNPLSFLNTIKEAQLLAFSTASSAAVMPLSMKIADERLGISSKVSDFVIPIGATINMDGTALFQCITVLFMAQGYGIDLSMLDVVLITVTVVSASIGTPAIPGGGVIVMTSVLQSSGIPVEGLIVIIGIDRVLGMFRTAINVTGDLVATVVFNRWFGSEFKNNEAVIGS